jgi:DNA-binding transcriptional MerR regulator
MQSTSTLNPSPGSVGKVGGALLPQNRANSVSITHDAEAKRARLHAKLEEQGFSPEEIQEVLDDLEAAEEDEADAIDGGIDGSREEP